MHNICHPCCPSFFFFAGRSTCEAEAWNPKIGWWRSSKVLDIGTVSNIRDPPRRSRLWSSRSAIQCLYTEHRARNRIIKGPGPSFATSKCWEVAYGIVKALCGPIEYRLGWLINYIGADEIIGELPIKIDNLIEDAEDLVALPWEQLCLPLFVRIGSLLVLYWTDTSVGSYSLHRVTDFELTVQSLHVQLLRSFPGNSCRIDNCCFRFNG